MLNLLGNAYKRCCTQAARAENDKTLSTTLGSSGASAGAGRHDPTGFLLHDTPSAAPALESMLVYSKFRGLGFRMVRSPILDSLNTLQWVVCVAHGAAQVRQ
mmetsp:Transcript_28441/g.48074  ORF Transcript_28441/g.48074 Transcript_28441/m.48074 type:complete len:102 (-) Transcript_28441:323-628(-)